MRFALLPCCQALALLFASTLLLAAVSDAQGTRGLAYPLHASRAIQGLVFQKWQQHPTTNLYLPGYSANTLKAAGPCQWISAGFHFHGVHKPGKLSVADRVRRRLPQQSWLSLHKSRVRQLQLQAETEPVATEQHNSAATTSLS